MKAKGQHPVRPLPPVTVEIATGGRHTWTEAAVRGTICNPIYAGVGPYPQMIEDEMWVRAAAKMIEQEGVEQFLVNMLHVLRQSFSAEAPGSTEG